MQPVCRKKINHFPHGGKTEHGKKEEEMKKRIGNLAESDGRITVEVSVIVPVLSLLITGAVFLWLFFLDVAVARGETLRIVGEAASAWKNEGKLSDGQYEKNRLLNRNFYFLWQNQRASISKEAKSRMESRIKARLSVSTLKSGTIVFRGQHVVVKTEIGLSWPLPGINKIMGTSPYCTCTAVAPVDNWQEKIRRKAAESWK